MGHEVTPYGNYYQTNERLEGDRKVFAEDWDLLLFMECGDGDPIYTELTNLRSRKRASWFFDAALYPHHWLNLMRAFEFDVNFMANRNMLYDNFNTHYLPYAADETIHYRPQGNKLRSFGLIGSDRPERRELAKSLKIDLMSNLFRDSFITYLAESRYTINDVAGGGLGLIPMRPFEALAAGSALITPKNDGIKALGIPCIEYESNDELVRICNHLFQDDIIPDNAGQNEVLRNHTYKSRCATILEQLFPYERN